MNYIARGDIKDFDSTVIDIKKVTDSPDGTGISLVAVISNITISNKNNGDKYLLLTLADKTATVEMPLWDNADAYLEELEVGTVVFVKGSKKSFNEKPQINKVALFLCTGFDKTDFMPKYDVDVVDLACELIDYAEQINDVRYFILLEEFLGIEFHDGVIDTVDREITSKSGKSIKILNKAKWDAFSTCPSAAKHHGAKIHGLLVHTLGVVKAVHNMIHLHDNSVINTEGAIDKDMLMFLAIVHDYCKTEEYRYDIAISYNDTLYVSHDVLLIGELQCANRAYDNMFSVEEMSKMYAIILTHHGEWSRYKPTGKDKYPIEARLLHCADMIDSQIVGGAER